MKLLPHKYTAWLTLTVLVLGTWAIWANIDKSVEVEFEQLAFSTSKTFSDIPITMAYVERPDPTNLIIGIAEDYGVDPDLALNLAFCESSLNPNALGDNGHSRGLWQISDIFHPEVSDFVAYDPQLSTEWAMWRISEGYGYEWTCYSLI